MEPSASISAHRRAKNLFHLRMFVFFPFCKLRFVSFPNRHQGKYLLWICWAAIPLKCDAFSSPIVRPVRIAF